MRWLLIAAALAAAVLEAGCGGGSSASPPGNVKVVAGDSSVTVSWDAESGVEYWVWVAPGTDTTTQDCSSNPSCKIITSASSPTLVTGLTNGTAYSVTVNGRRDSGPGGPGTDPITFVPRPAGSVWMAGGPLGPNDLLGVAFTSATNIGGATLVGVGANGTIYSTTDGANWTAAASGVTGSLDAVQYRDGLFIALGDGGTILTSPDAVTWTPEVSPTTNALTALTGDDSSTIVAVGARGTILVSTNGIDWTLADSGTTNDLHGVAFGNGRYVAVGANGTLLTSTDGSTWTTDAPVSAATLQGVAYGSTAATAAVPAVATYVAVGAAGTVVTSTDGVAWTAQPPVSTNALAAVTYGTEFVAVGAGGSIFRSADTTAWLPAESETTEDLNAVTFTLLAANAIGIGYAAVGDAGMNLTAR